MPKNFSSILSEPQQKSSFLLVGEELKMSRDKSILQTELPYILVLMSQNDQSMELCLEHDQAPH